MLVYRAKCCNPIPGDEIVGYITRGRGVAVHTRTCPNVQNLLYQTERRIAVEWGGENAATFPVELQIRARDRAGLLADITAVISGAGSNIRNLVSRPDGLNARIDAKPGNRGPAPVGDDSREYPQNCRGSRGRARSATGIRNPLSAKPARQRVPVLRAGIAHYTADRALRLRPLQ